MTKFNGHRVGRVAGGGLYNGFNTPRAKQEWTIGAVVNVGFLKGLEVLAKANGSYALRQTSTGRIYSFTPHLGIARCETVSDALAA